jgi:hypothetical protein
MTRSTPQVLANGNAVSKHFTEDRAVELGVSVLCRVPLC